MSFKIRYNFIGIIHDYMLIVVAVSIREGVFARVCVEIHIRTVTDFIQQQL